MTRSKIVRLLDKSAPQSMHVARRLRRTFRRFLSRDAIEAHRRSTLISEPWFVDDIHITDSDLTVRGWAFPPVRWTKDIPAEILLNGRRFDNIDYFDRNDVADKFWQRERAENCGFIARSSIAREHAFPDGLLTLTHRNPSSILPRGLNHTWYLLDPQLEGPLPSDIQRRRVIGNDDPAGFLLSGATDFYRMIEAVQAVTGRTFGQFSSILDWGCGCGRVARYATRFAPREFVGCDIDKENANWCANHLRGAFVHTSMHPPLPFGEEAFDLIYGISIFTHFREPLQDAWLSELRRVIRKGGYVFVTVHGRTAIDYAGLAPMDYVSLLGALNKQGLFVAGKNDQLDGAVAGSNEYVNAFHSAAYIKKHWSRYFSVVAIVPGYIFTHDLVAIRRVD